MSSLPLFPLLFLSLLLLFPLFTPTIATVPFLSPSSPSSFGCFNNSFPLELFSTSTGVSLGSLSFSSSEGLFDFVVCNLQDQQHQLYQQQPLFSGGFPISFSIGYDCSCGGGRGEGKGERKGEGEGEEGEEKKEWKIVPSGCDWEKEKFCDDSFSSIPPWEECEEEGGKGGKCHQENRFGCPQEPSFSNNINNNNNNKSKNNNNDKNVCSLECETTLSPGRCRTFRLFFPPGLRRGGVGVVVQTPIVGVVEEKFCLEMCLVGPSCSF